ncbi:MAG: DUF3854 domain-containing protein [Candidatus Pacebacteria bacterium]|nr:DUF3854 domain-containing protein [Candidatus Paceibacterota bacterium]
MKNQAIKNPGAGQASGANEIITSHNIQWMWEDCQRSLIVKDDLQSMGWHATPDGYAIPYRDPATGEAITCPDGRPYTRTRLRYPQNGVKYLSLKSGGIRCFIHPDAHEAITKTPDLPLYLTEGEKKAACATLLGMPCIGLGGIWLWKQSGTEGDLNHDLLPYVQDGRDVVLIYDSDATETPRKTRDFADCARRLAVALEPYGCRLYRFDMPPGDSGKVGLDDWLAENDGDTILLREIIEGRAA